MKTQITNETLRGIAQITNIRTSKSPIDFEVLYADFYDPAGNIVGKPELLYISVLINGKITRIYKYHTQHTTEYIDSTGTVLGHTCSKGSQLGSPLSCMKITSRFGVRRHPISGRYKKHTGVDLSAKVGTPVRSAAPGIVRLAHRHYGYGKYIQLRHTPKIDTAYGHLSRIVVRPGQHVSRGQIIGYTGASGYTSGPHLHYEVLRDGRPINPLCHIKQEALRLTGRELVNFTKYKKTITLQLVGLHPTSDKPGKKAKI
jgi:murein DD-endopeptidase MepM/ murein hydrolase activator NlpD